MLAPPHTRGWSPEGRRWSFSYSGSPAHAGMVPEVWDALIGGIWLPRTRGDGPIAGGTVSSSEAAPPHTRGWSHAALTVRRRVAGSPAHAGMVPG